jgi:hypothetical protein
MSAPLAVVEAQALAEREAVIERGLATFVDVGTALAEIRDDRLYRASFPTFEDYCRGRWNLSRAHAYRMIDAAAAVSPIGDMGLPLPANESQARELAHVPAEDRADVWAQTVERTNGKPTAAAIRETVAHPPILIPKHQIHLPSTAWTTAETELCQRIEDGETVVVSQRGEHARLIDWATERDLFVRIDRRSEWGNPFEMPADGDRQTVIANYRTHYLPHKPSLTAALDTLRGKALGCWCSPDPCHGDVLAAWADERGEHADH